MEEWKYGNMEVLVGELVEVVLPVFHTSILPHLCFSSHQAFREVVPVHSPIAHRWGLCHASHDRSP
jgi:hypothetical protein